jgi:hypothetical protein
MSRKDYELIAAAIKEELTRWGDMTSVAEVQMARAIASRIAKAMQDENIRFDYARFMKACGFEV